MLKKVSENNPNGGHKSQSIEKRTSKKSASHQKSGKSPSTGSAHIVPAGPCGTRQVWNTRKNKCVCKIIQKCASAGARFDRNTCQWVR